MAKRNEIQTQASKKEEELKNLLNDLEKGSQIGGDTLSEMSEVQSQASSSSKQNFYKPVMKPPSKQLAVVR